MTTDRSHTALSYSDDAAIDGDRRYEVLPAFTPAVAELFDEGLPTA